MTTKIEQFVSTNSVKEKVEVRTYDNGITRYYVYQGKRWWPLERRVFDEWMEAKWLCKEKDYLEARLAEWNK